MKLASANQVYMTIIAVARTRPMGYAARTGIERHIHGGVSLTCMDNYRAKARRLVNQSFLDIITRTGPVAEPGGNAAPLLPSDVVPGPKAAGEDPLPEDL